MLSHYKFPIPAGIRIKKRPQYSTLVVYGDQMEAVIWTRLKKTPRSRVTAGVTQ